MAHALRYYKELTQPDGSIIRLEIYKKDSNAPALEIGEVVQALHLDIQGGADAIDAPIVKTLLTMTFVDAPDHADASTKKCGNWEEFYTPDSTMWKVVVKVNGTTIWGGYVTPDSYTEDLRYRGSVTLIARDNIGHMQDFPFDMEGNADGMVTLQELVNAAWAKIESPMTLDWRHEEDDADYLLCEGVEAPQTYMNVSAFEDMNFYDAVDKALYSYGLVMRYTGGNVVCIMSLRDMPYQGRVEPRHTEPTFVAHAQRELAPAARRIEESVKYDLGEGMQIPLAKSVEFSGEESTVPFYSTNIFGETVTTNIPVHPIINTSGEGWSNIPSGTLFFNPREYTIREDGLNEDVKRMLYIACNTDGSHLVSYSNTVICQDFRISLSFGRVIQRSGSEVRYCYGFASGTEGNGIGSIKVRKVSGYITAEQNGVTYHYTGEGWQAEPYRLNIESEEDGFGIDIGFQDISGQAKVSFFIENIELDAMRDYSDGDGLYVPISSMYWGVLSAQSLCSTNNVNTVYVNSNNIIIDRSPKFAPALDEVPFPSIIRNGIFVKSGNAYLPAKRWAWGGGTPQQMAVYNHLQLLCYHSKPNNVISGDIVDADFLNIAMIYYWGGSEHLLVAGSYNFLNGRIESAVLREFTRYTDMWSDVSGAEMPETEEKNKTTAETGGTANASTYSNETTVNIGGSGGGTGGSSTLAGLDDVKITDLSNEQYLKYDSGLGKWVNRSLDTAISNTSVNGVQNKVIKAFVESEAKKAQIAAEQYIRDEVLLDFATKTFAENEAKNAQAAAEQYILNEVLTDYATTKYVEEREVYLEGYTEEWVTALENDIKTNPSSFITLKTINNQSLFGRGNIEVTTTVEWNDIAGRPTNLSQFTDDVVAGHYLPLTGGTVSGNLTINGYLYANSRIVEKSIMEFHHIDGDFVFLANDKYSGKGDGQGLAMYNKTYWHSLIHSGNYATEIGDYYLKSSGGILSDSWSGGTEVRRKDANNGYASLIFSQANGTILGRFGFGGVDNPLFITSTGGYNTLIHSGNIGSQSVNYATNAAKLGGYDITQVLPQILQSYRYIEAGTDLDTLIGENAGWWNSMDNIDYTNGPKRNFGLLSARINTAYFGQLAFGYGSSELMYRSQYYSSSEKIWSSWKTIAFTDSTVEAAKRIVNDNGDFVIYRSGSGNIIVGDNNGAGDTYLLGNNIYLRYGGSATYGLILNSYGNVTIGGSDLARTNAKLYVNGKSYFAAYSDDGHYVRLGARGAYGLHIETRSIGNTYFQSQRFDGTTAYYNIVLQELGGKVFIGDTRIDSGAKLQVATTFRDTLPSLGSLGSGSDFAIQYTSTYACFGLYFSLDAQLGNTTIQTGRSDGGTATYALLLNPLGGNVGIGTESPQYKLDVAGAGRFTGLASFDAGVKIGTTTLSNTNLGLSINTSFYPLSVGLSLGHSSYRWHNVFANNVRADEVKIGDATLTWDGAALKVDKPFYSTSQVSAGAKAVEAQAVIAPLELTSKPIASTTTEYTDAEIASQFGLTSDVLANLAKGIYTRVTYKSIIESLVWSYEVYYVGESKTIILRNGTGSTYNSRNYKFERDSTTGKWKITNA